MDLKDKARNRYELPKLIARNATNITTNKKAIEAITPSENATEVFVKKITLTADAINNIGTTAVDIIAAQGAGTVINILSCAVSLTYGTTAFDANDLGLVFNGAGTNIVTISGLLDDTSSNFRNCTVLSGDNNLVANAKIQATGTDSVATGDSPIDLYISYEVITL